MRVLLFTDTLGDINGVARFVLSAAAEARSTGHGLRVVTSTRKPVPPAANVLNVPPRWACAMPGYPPLDLAWPPWRALWESARAWAPDAIHVSTPGPVGMAGRRIARRLGVPLVGVYHTDFPAYVGRLFDDAAMTWCASAAMRWFYGCFDRVLVRSESYSERVASLGVARDRIGVLKPGVHAGAFHPRWRTTEGACPWPAFPGVNPRAVKVLYCGRVSVEKGLTHLERVWTRVRAGAEAAGLSVQMLIVGDGPQRAALEASLARVGGAVFLGFRSGEELSRLYASADLFVFPSTTDTLGQVVMEAQASGLPVLVTDQGGPREVVRDGVTGHVLGAHDAEAWARAIVRLVTDAGARRAMGAAAHEHMRSFTSAASFEHFWRVHEQAVRCARTGSKEEGSQRGTHEAAGIKA